MRILREEATVYRNMMHFLRIFVVRNVRNVVVRFLSEQDYCVCPEDCFVFFVLGKCCCAFSEQDIVYVLRRRRKNKTE